MTILSTNVIFERQIKLVGEQAHQHIGQSKVILFGVGGVGSVTAEMLARSGVGGITLVDFDTIAPSNINRQLPALHSTIGRHKADVVAERLRDINPAAEIRAIKGMITPENAHTFFDAQYDVAIDAIDMLSGKVAIVKTAQSAGIQVISCMGAGNKRNPSLFRVGDIYSTTVCPLARKFRKLLRDEGVESLKVVYSTEEPIKPIAQPICAEGEVVSHSPGSICYVTAAAGLILAAEALNMLI